jgi:hypothetical protein
VGAKAIAPRTTRLPTLGACTLPGRRQTPGGNAVKIGIDSFCYHRFFGEVYPGLEADPGASLSVPEFIDRALAHAVDGVAIESFMLESDAPAHLTPRRPGGSPSCRSSAGKTSPGRS